MKSEVQYKRAIISFFDILGFQDTVESVESPGEVLRRLKKLKYHSKAKGSSSIPKGKFLNFSDTVIRTIEIPDMGPNAASALLHELSDLAHIQATLVMEGILIRGGVTIGEIFQGQSFVFGPGLNRAYHLEKDIAVYPRIVIDPKAFSLLNFDASKSRHNSPITDSVKGFLRESSDGVWFLDYLKPMPPSFGTNRYMILLNRHRELITHQASRFLEEGLTSLAVKYNWLAKYHNDTVASLASGNVKIASRERIALHITKAEVKTMHEF